MTNPIWLKIHSAEYNTIYRWDANILLVMKISIRLLLLFIASSLLPIVGKSQTFDALCKQRVELGETPGMSVALYENGKVTFLSFGVSDLSTRELVTPKTLFEIGSITKTFTCSLLAAMVNTGEIELESNAINYLPSYFSLPVLNGKQITIEHLATARSGLPRLPNNLSPADESNPYIDFTEAKLVEALKTTKLTREPGSKYEYSNLGMGLLGYILAKKKSTTYSDLVQLHILTALKMKSTLVNGRKIEAKSAIGYVDNIPVKAWTWTDESVLVGTGGLISNAEDMITYLTAQLESDNTKLNAAFKLTHRERAMAGDTYQIGLGWHILNHRYIWHNGGTGGFRSFAGFDPVAKRAIVILTNSSEGADDLAFHWLDNSYLIKKLKPPFKVDVLKLREYEGHYEISPQFGITLSTEGESLMAQATGQQKLRIYPDGPDSFYYKQVDAKIVFSRATTGIVAGLTLIQGGENLNARKIK